MTERFSLVALHCFSLHIIMRMQVPQEGPCNPIAPLELPHSLHAFHRVTGSDELNVVGHISAATIYR